MTTHTHTHTHNTHTHTHTTQSPSISSHHSISHWSDRCCQSGTTYSNLSETSQYDYDPCDRYTQHAITLITTSPPVTVTQLSQSPAGSVTRQRGLLRAEEYLDVIISHFARSRRQPLLRRFQPATLLRSCTVSSQLGKLVLTCVCVKRV